MGAGWYNVETDTTFSCRVSGFASSTNPEAKAVLTAIEMSPPDVSLHVYTDSLTIHLML